MRYLVDTNILLMWLVDDPLLGHDIWCALSDPMNEAYVSSVTALDITERKRQKEMDCPNNLEGVCIQSGFKLLPLEFPHIAEYERMMASEQKTLDLSMMLLIAQSKVESLTLLTTHTDISHFNIGYILQHAHPTAKRHLLKTV